MAWSPVQQRAMASGEGSAFRMEGPSAPPRAAAAGPQAAFLSLRDLRQAPWYSFAVRDCSAICDSVAFSRSRPNTVAAPHFRTTCSHSFFKKSVYANSGCRLAVLPAAWAVHRPSLTSQPTVCACCAGCPTPRQPPVP